MRIDQLNDEQRAFVESIYAQCTEEGDCMIWEGRVTSSGYPRIWVDGKNMMVRRLLVELKIGRPLARGEIAASKCKDQMCLCWSHAKAMTTAERRAETGADGGYSSHTKGLRISISHRKTAKLEGGEASAAAIRMDSRASHVVGPDYGISASMVRKIRRGEAWKAIQSPFAGLGARA
ncbi:MAG TPA: hypothetical protein DCY64_22645 [Hydrogenophaga sp.]|uniref:hypothetical protein n=1 Tax=Hydrogenophaga sp. TaxID=1904254 RepID=UPI0008AEECDA|nr:hypothetical protein [Hydrogenophaga sp.]OGA78784.1 MAG: hypothetical protein A2X73_07480 [Burkholderiales bacterium GWE1_65_30]OGA89355.1 MAG: hypothetical protein A2X72_16640 [Burkholderiales bacterium GWF1_66_17]HAX23071.1 hypothetical protein [Hydrogenophaga sp.]HBU17065.1 hypothetical protein [Hydrogenophaga sp.]